jgi:hypothetical protein
MTNLLTGPITGTCDICQRPTGNLPMHRPACARDHGRLPLAEPISLKEEELVFRAGLHAVPPGALHPSEQLRRGVSDLDVARLVHQIERGNIIYPSTTHKTWRSTGPVPRGRRALSTVVSEALRLGIVHPVVEHSSLYVYRTRLEAAPTHARRRGTANRPACGLLSVRVWRWRLLDADRLMFVDCQACLDLPVSCAQPAS